MRKTEIDILRGLMIICVLIGHCSFASHLKLDVFWFHMPVFFMISGYLIKIPLQNPFKNREYLKKKTVRYVLPYFSYSIVLYCIFHPESILKNLVRTLYAGYNNITIYSYPFWFINTLFVSSIGFTYLLWMTKKYKNSTLILSVITTLLFIAIHSNIYPLPFPLPWGLDQMLGALVFIYIGYIYRGKENSKSLYFILPLIAVSFSILNLVYDYDYTLNMQKMEYNNFILDLIIPCSFAMLFYGLSLIIKNIPIGNKIFEEFGKASMTIFFTHAAIFCFIGNEYPMIRIATALALGYLIHRLLLVNTYLRLFFIGEYGSSIYKQKS